MNSEMKIKKIVIENYKLFNEFELDLNDDLNIIVGDNETGKSTLLEAINLALTGQLYGRSIVYELSSYLFNRKCVEEYISKLKDEEKIAPPRILIELYFANIEALASFRGTNNSRKENTPGVFISIELNEDYIKEYQNYIENPNEVKAVPTEYYEVKWLSFAYNPITQRGLPLKGTFIDTTSVRLYSGTDYYINKTIDELLEAKERANLSLLFRKLKESFAKEEPIKSINTKLKENKDIIPDKDLTISIDISQKTNWDANLTSYLNEIPFQYIGKGDQNILKIIFALEREKAKESSVILIEEPENHLSFTTMNMLIKMLNEKIKDKQIVITTHSTFVLNKLGIEKVILLGDNTSTLTLKELSDDTQKYFKKLPGYDTLRLLISRKAILVEGPSDELFVQKAYLQKNGRLPIEDGIDVISVKGLSFERFLEIGKVVSKKITVVTDNDGNCEKLKEKYKDFIDLRNINICYDEDENYTTLESQIVKNNNLETLNKILNREDASKSDLLKYMSNNNNKTKCALRFFETDINVNIPQYILDAIQ